MIVRSATLQDLQQIAQLEIDNLHDEHQLDPSLKHGQAFSLKELTEIFNTGWIVVAEVDSVIIGYVIAASWSFFNKWPIYKKMYQQLPQHNISQQQSCQYGPIWIHQTHRGIGVFQQLVNEIKTLSKKQYHTLVTFIAENNERSLSAHTNKAKMQVIDYFDFQERGYYLLKASDFR